MTMHLDILKCEWRLSHKPPSLGTTTSPALRKPKKHMYIVASAQSIAASLCSPQYYCLHFRKCILGILIEHTKNKTTSNLGKFHGDEVSGEISTPCNFRTVRLMATEVCCIKKLLYHYGI